MYDYDNPELAQTYDRLSDTQYQSGIRLLERLGVKHGDRVLDIGCGTGRLAEWIYSRVGIDGVVVGTDPLADRIAIARQRSSQLRFEVGQAEDLSPFADQSFDVVCMSAVFHWVKDKPKALAEVARVLAKGGRMGMTTLPGELHRAGTVAEVCGQVIGRASYRERLDFGRFASAPAGIGVTDTIQMILESGLQLIELHIMRIPEVHESGQSVIDFIDSSSFGNFLSRVPSDLRDTFQVDLAQAFDALKGPSGVVLQKHGMMLLAGRG